jgi:hypothetical protein
MSDVEVWKPIDGSPGYQVSDQGRVRSPSRLLRPGLGSHGYLGVALGRSRHALVHRLVIEAFRPPIDGLPHVNHLDGVKTNNRLDNLEWSNKSQNQHHAIAAGLFQGPPLRPGEQNGNAKLTDERVREIRRLRATGLTYKAIGEAMSIPTMTAFHACKIGWKTVT